MKSRKPSKTSFPVKTSGIGFGSRRRHMTRIEKNCVLSVDSLLVIGVTGRMFRESIMCFLFIQSNPISIVLKGNYLAHENTSSILQRLRLAQRRPGFLGRKGL